jgi:DNA-directed RNA polymerase specialized sigma subunit
MSERNKLIIELRFKQKCTYAYIAKQFDISIARVEQICNPQAHKKRMRLAGRSTQYEFIENKGKR